jgi:exodeoxyribonuclease-5
MSIVLSDVQGRAVSKIRRWFDDQHYGDSTQQVFRLFGYAGTGKTTIIENVIGELGLFGSQVVYAAFAGKAAVVMRKKGLPATTIHSLIYIPSMASDEVIEAEEDKLKDMKQRKVERKLILEQQKKLKNLRTPSWHVNEDSDAANAALIVIDEVSMVDKRLAEDLLSFGTPILVVGDPGQLPPVKSEKGEGYFMRAKPDVMLTEIHRQALDSPIIRLATMVREGKPIPYGKFGQGVRKVPMIHKTATYLKYDQVICGKNVTRYRLNNEIRKKLGFKDLFPTGETEKIMCLKNNYDVGLINGMFVVLKGVKPYGENYIQADVFDEEGNILVNDAVIYKGEFLQHVKFKQTRLEDDWKIRRGIVETTYGWVITCHKSQGSQWRKIMVIDESSSFRNLHRQWLYTAITRAESRLTIVG